MVVRESSQYSSPVQIKEKMIGDSLFLLIKEARLFNLGIENPFYLVKDIIKK